MIHLTFFSGNHIPPHININLNWSLAGGGTLGDPTYLLIVRKSNHYSPPNDPTDDPITIKFRKSRKTPLLSVISHTPTITLPPEKLNRLSLGVYPLFISVSFYIQNHVNNFAQKGILEIVDPKFEAFRG